MAGAASCSNAIKDGSETDVDCGGAACPACAPGQSCVGGSDCTSLVCSSNVCQAPTCVDGIRNGSETDIDCGGPCVACSSCSCYTGADCASGVCVACQCIAPTCSDGVENGTELGVDCGGACAACLDGAAPRDGAPPDARAQPAPARDASPDAPSGSAVEAGTIDARVFDPGARAEAGPAMVDASTSSGGGTGPSVRGDAAGMVGAGGASTSVGPNGPPSRDPVEAGRPVRVDGGGDASAASGPLADTNAVGLRGGGCDCAAVRRSPPRAAPWALLFFVPWLRRRASKRPRVVRDPPFATRAHRRSFVRQGW